jgi:peptidyl-prolyl cis-trans isomerase C
MLVVTLLAACRGFGPSVRGTPALTQPTLTAQSAATATPAVPTDTPAPSPTPVPLMATVNDQAIPLAVYDQELARCQKGLTEAALDPATCPATVYDTLVQHAVVEQAARAAGLSVAAADVDAALETITAELGGPSALEAWLQVNLYSLEQLRAGLEAEQLRSLMLAQVVAAVPPTAEQVHARDILLTDADTAQAVLNQLQAGSDFATLALSYSRDLGSRAAGGDLGWFPRGVLTQPDVEAAVFALEPGQTSAVVASPLGFHILQVLERDPARPLSPAAADTLRAAAYAAWVQARLAEAVIVRQISP